jgi:hypothetical protein
MRQVSHKTVPYLKLLWPVIVLCSALGVILVTVVFPATAVRPLIVMWFLFVCPGMITVQLFLSVDWVVEWTLALALSFSIDAIVAGIQVYTGHWSPAITLEILIVFCTLCAVIKILRVTLFSEVQSKS